MFLKNGYKTFRKNVYKSFLKRIRATWGIVIITIIKYIIHTIVTFYCTISKFSRIRIIFIVLKRICSSSRVSKFTAPKIYSLYYIHYSFSVLTVNFGTHFRVITHSNSPPEQSRSVLIEFDSNSKWKATCVELCQKCRLCHLKGKQPNC